MPTLQIRNLDEAVYAALKEAAAREHRSIAQQAAHTLKKALNGDDSARERRRALLDEILTENAKSWPRAPGTPAELIRADRDR